MALYTKTWKRNKEKTMKMEIVSPELFFFLFILKVKAAFSLVSTLLPTFILMLEVSCQSARCGLLHFYSAAVLPVLPMSVTVSWLVTNFSSNSLALQIFSHCIKYSAHFLFPSAEIGLSQADYCLINLQNLCIWLKIVALQHYIYIPYKYMEALR